MKKEKILIMAYMGTGKTELEQRYENIADFDFQDFKFVYDKSIAHLPLEQRKGNVNLRTENFDYPRNFLEGALAELNAGHIVVSPFIEHVFNAYNSSEFKKKAKDVRVIIVAPSKNNFEEYVSRFKNRGNGDDFIRRRRVEFPSLMNLFETAGNCERIVMKPGQFLDDALIQYGISLEQKASKKICNKAKQQDQWLQNQTK